MKKLLLLIILTLSIFSTAVLAESEVRVGIFDRVKAFFTGQSAEEIAEERAGPADGHFGGIPFEEDSTCKVNICQTDGMEIHCTDTFRECAERYEQCRVIGCEELEIIPEGVCQDNYQDPRPNECCCVLDSVSFHTGATTFVYNDYGFIDISECPGDCLDRRYCLQDDGEICCQLSDGTFGWVDSEDETGLCRVATNDRNCLIIGDGGSSGVGSEPRDPIELDDDLHRFIEVLPGLGEVDDEVDDETDDETDDDSEEPRRTLEISEADLSLDSGCERNVSEEYLDYMETIIRNCEILNVTTTRIESETFFTNCVGYIHECDFRIVSNEEHLISYRICDGREIIDREFIISDCIEDEDIEMIIEDAPRREDELDLQDYGIPEDCEIVGEAESTDDGRISALLECDEHVDIGTCYVYIEILTDSGVLYEVEVRCDGIVVDEDFWTTHRMSILEVGDGIEETDRRTLTPVDEDSEDSGLPQKVYEEEDSLEPIVEISPVVKTPVPTNKLTPVNTIKTTKT